MKRNHTVVPFAIILLFTCGLAFALNYQYFTDTEVTRFGDRIKFFSGDSLSGVVRTNECLGLMNSPSPPFSLVIMGGDSCPPPAGGWPDSVILNAPQLPFPQSADWIRNWAFEQGNYFNPGPFMKARVRIIEDSLRIRYAPQGAPFDSSYDTGYHLPDSAVVFFECPVQMQGVISTVLIFGAGGTVGLEDNLLYVSADPITGRAPLGHPEKFALVAEGDIKILNTYANGRENSGGRGNSQTHQDSTDIVLDGFYIALNESFTFENQNDPDSGYVCIPCGCSADGRGGGPDDRGQIFLYGMLAQERRGYVHRSNCTSTGYLKSYRFDRTLEHWDIGLFHVPENVPEPAALDFGRVAVNDTAWDTVRIVNEIVPITVDSVVAPPEFVVRLPDDSARWVQAIAVGFAPEEARERHDTLRVLHPYFAPDHWISIPLHGQGIWAGSSGFILPPSSFILSASPNPFNSRTEISFAIPHPGNVSLVIHDLLGREVATLLNANLAAGDHTAVWDASGCSTGLYFLRLTSNQQVRTLKLLLLK
jgi:hypothetical protein